MQRLAAPALLAACATAAGAAEVIVVPAMRDNTLIEDLAGSRSNGAGPNVIAGRVRFGDTRRGLIAFDIAAAVPPGSRITGAVLTMTLNRTAEGPEPVSLHRALADWGEGASSTGGGNGAPSAPGDATWIHRFFDDVFWSAPGGDFAALVSAVTEADGDGVLSWGSTPEMVADVQSWLDDPAGNHGWLLLGNEDFSATVQVLDSREHPDPARRPRLEIEFERPCLPANPRGPGYWHRQCLGLPADLGGLDPGRRGVGPDGFLEPGFAETLLPCANERLAALGIDATTCEALDAARGACDHARRDVTTWILNVCSDRVQTSCPVDRGPAWCSAGNVGELLEQLAQSILDGDCRRASVCAAAAR